MKHKLLYYPLIVHLILLFIANEHPLIMNTHRITNTTSSVSSFRRGPHNRRGYYNTKML